MKLSIIIPVLNECQNLSVIAEQLLLLRRQGQEVIIIDGGSDDDTLTIAHKIADKVLVSKAGRALQMNNGATVATGDVFLFLHADTILPQQTLEIISHLHRNCRYWGRFDIRLSGNRLAFRIIEYFVNLRSCITSMATGDQAIFIEKSLFHHVGGFPEIALMEDIEISKRLKEKSKAICVKHKVVTSSRRWENKGVIATVLLMWKLRLYYFFGVSPDKLKQLYR